MPSEKSPSQGQIRPDDPRYESWLLICASLQMDQDAASEEFIKAFRNGKISIADVVKFIGQQFDAEAKAIVLTVNGAATLQLRLDSINELLPRFVNERNEWFLAAARMIGVPADYLESEVRLSLTERLYAARQEASRLALQNEIARPKDVAGKPEVNARHVFKWEDLEIKLISDHSVETKLGDRREILNYEEMGMMDRRNGNPNGSWTILKTIASESSGVLPDDQRRSDLWASVEKQVERTRKALRKRFGLGDDPLPYERGVGYRARFKISRSSSSE